MKRYLFFFLLLVPFYLFAQSNDLWLFPPNVQVKIIEPTYEIKILGNNFPFAMEGHSIIQDSSNNLLFYTDGGKIYDRDHNLMPESLSIPMDQESNSVQQCNIVNSSDDDSKYFMFSLDDGFTNNSKLYLSTIDMKLRDGKGDVVKNSITTIDSGYTEAMLIIPHSCAGYWVVLNKRNSANFDAFHFLGNQLIKKITSNVGSNFSTILSRYATMLLLSNEEIIHTNNGSIEKIKFDNITGKLERTNLISDPLGSKVSNIALSPNKKLLYAREIKNGIHYINQYEIDLKNTAEILASRVEIFKGINFAVANFTTVLNKIYLISSVRNTAISVIPFPNIKGINAKFELDAMLLPNPIRSTRGFPSPLIIEKGKNMLTFLPQDTTSCKEISIMPNSPLDSIQWSTGSTAPMITLSQSGQYNAIGYKDGCPYLDTFRLTIQHVTQSKTIETCGTSGITYKGRIYNIGDQFIDTIAGATCDTLLQYSVIKSPTGIEKKETIYLCGGGAHRSPDGTIYRDGDSYTATKKSNASSHCDTIIHYTITALYRNNFLGNDTTSCKHEPLIKSVNLFVDEKILWEDGTTDPFMKFDKRTVNSYNYKAQLFSNGCTFLDTVKLTHINKVEIVKKIICIGEKIQHEGKEYGVGEPYFIRRKTEYCDTVTFYALINPPPIKIMTKDAYTASIGLSLDVLYSFTPASYLWQPSENLSCSDCPIPKVLRPISGIYTITAKDQYGCIYTDSLVVEAMNEIVLPTIIRPNATTTENSHFYLKSKDNLTYDMLIFDRWGNKVFNVYNIVSNDAAAGWSPSESLSNGVYQYRIVIHYDKGDIVKVSDVTILR